MAKQFAGLGATIIDSVADLPAAAASLEGLLFFQKDTNELKICDGSSWISMLDTDTPPAVQLIIPTSVAGTGVSVTNGAVSWSSATTVSVNGVFTSAFSNYRVVWVSTSNTGGGGVRIKTRLSGVDSGGGYSTVGGEYGVSGTVGNFTNWGTNRQAITYGEIAALQAGTTVIGGTMDFFSPAPVTYTSINFHSGGYINNTGNDMVVGNVLNYASAAADGFTIYTSGTNWSGNLRVYGYRDSI